MRTDRCKDGKTDPFTIDNIHDGTIYSRLFLTSAAHAYLVRRGLADKKGSYTEVKLFEAHDILPFAVVLKRAMSKAERLKRKKHRTSPTTQSLHKQRAQSTQQQPPRQKAQKQTLSSSIRRHHGNVCGKTSLHALATAHLMAAS